MLIHLAQAGDVIADQRIEPASMVGELAIGVVAAFDQTQCRFH
jgi:hypothetical protein